MFSTRHRCLLALKFSIPYFLRQLRTSFLAYRCFVFVPIPNSNVFPDLLLPLILPFGLYVYRAAPRRDGRLRETT